MKPAFAAALLLLAASPAAARPSLPAECGKLSQEELKMEPQCRDWLLQAQERAARPQAVAPERARSIGERAIRMRTALGASALESAPVHAAGAALGGAPAAPDSPFSRRGKAAVPSPAAFHSMADAAAAPKPGWGATIGQWVWSSGKIVAQDLSTVRSRLADFRPPEGTEGLNGASPEALARFFDWMRTAKDSDLPSISYAALEEGEIGRYNFSILGKGTIHLNYYLQGAEPEARAAVLLHELYHYWDKKIARNPYPNETYGVIGPSHKHEHEYDPYFVTALFWAHARPAGASSPLAAFLDKLPKDGPAVRALIDREAARVR